MRPYETLVVLSSSLGSEQQPLIKKLEDLIKSSGGTLDESRDWGSKKLAYQIQKQSDGHYYLIEYQAEGDLVSELERTLRITDGVLRFSTVQQEHTGLPEPRQREMPRRDVPLSEMRGDRGPRPDGPRRDAPNGPPPAADPAATPAPEATAAPEPEPAAAPEAPAAAAEPAAATEAAPAAAPAGETAEEKTNE
jgi:small subunit ribosomal protein S6